MRQPILFWRYALCTHDHQEVENGGAYARRLPDGLFCIPKIYIDIGIFLKSLQWKILQYFIAIYYF
jgi:hypothetical protein